jgi:hypothetical protein
MTPLTCKLAERPERRQCAGSRRSKRAAPRRANFAYLLRDAEKPSRVTACDHLLLDRAQAAS